MAYRADFLLNLVISLVFTSMGPIVQYLIFTQTSGYPGWNTEQILLFQGILLLSMGLNNTFLGDVKGTAVNIMRNGDFDRYLIKPYPAIGVLLTGGFSLKHVGTLIAGTAITLYMLVSMRLVPGALEIILFLWFIAAGVIAYMGITILFCGLVIVLIQMGRLESFLDNVLRFAGYPMELYKGLFHANPGGFTYTEAAAGRAGLLACSGASEPFRLEYDLGQLRGAVHLRPELEILELVHPQIYKRRGLTHERCDYRSKGS